MIHILDLGFQGYSHAIAAFLIETQDGPVLIETGPYSTFSNLEREVSGCGFRMEDINNVLLSHIHLDHAGASWALAEKGANIYLHPFGAPHMENPARLMESARMIYKEEMDRLWGEMKNIPPGQLNITEDREEVKIGEHTFRSLHTPGHARHHIAWLMGDIIFTGDIAGVKIDRGPVVPPCPPPDINLEDWNNSIDLILKEKPGKLYLTHFGPVESIDEHLSGLREILNDWACWIKDKWESGMSPEEITPLFMKYTASQLADKGVDQKGIERYEAANPSWMSVAGLIRYWKKKAI